MAKKIYIGNLGRDTTEDSLRQAFAAHGEVTLVNMSTNPANGRPRSFAFVEMATDQAAKAAIAALNGTTLDDRQLNVAEARPPRERSRYSDRGRNRR